MCACVHDLIRNSLCSYDREAEKWRHDSKSQPRESKMMLPEENHMVEPQSPQLWMRRTVVFSSQNYYMDEIKE